MIAVGVTCSGFEKSAGSVVLAVRQRSFNSKPLIWFEKLGDGLKHALLGAGSTRFQENKGPDTFLPGQGKTSDLCGQREAGDDSWPKPLTFLFAESAGKLAGA